MPPERSKKSLVVSVVGDGFVYVRGLGERYSATQLNGAVIPTTEPEKRVVPLDLFPSGMIDNIKIAKTYSPDLPGEFSGGLVADPIDGVSLQGAPQRIDEAGLQQPRPPAARFLSYPGTAVVPTSGASALEIARCPVSSDPISASSRAAWPPDQLQTYGRAFADVWEPNKINRVRPADRLVRQRR